MTDHGPATASDAPRPSEPAFAHASEAEMARILDFYAVAWEYEPHTFPILWNLDGAVVESFSPDFWLPDLGLYLEMTTLRQRLVRKKNRKLRRLRELYPDIRIKLFYARDFRALMLKYGKLALVDALSGTSGQVPSPRLVPVDAAPIGASGVGGPGAGLDPGAIDLQPAAETLLHAEPPAVEPPAEPGASSDRPVGGGPTMADGPARAGRPGRRARRRRAAAADRARAVERALPPRASPSSQASAGAEA